MTLRAPERFLFAAAVIACLLATAGPAAQAAAPAQAVCAGNLLQNPDFEGGSRKTEGEGTSLSSAVSDGWSPWFVRGSESVNREPEFKVEQVAIGGDPARVRSGGQSMKWFTTWATHSAGIYQRVNVSPGSRLQFSAHGMIYTGEGDIFDEDRKTWVSDPQRSGNYRIWVGIDPTGAVPAGVGSAPPASVVWSESSMTPDDWVPLSVTAVAQAGAVTVYLKGEPEWSVKHNDSFWEDACLTVVGRGPAPAPAAQEPVAEPAADEPAEAVADAPEPTEPPTAAARPVSGRGSPEATALPSDFGQPAATIERVPWPGPAVAGERWALAL